MQAYGGFKPGERAIVTDICMNTDMRRRLQDMGLIEGTLVECVGISLSEIHAHI